MTTTVERPAKVAPRLKERAAASRSPRSCAASFRYANVMQVPAW